MAARGDRYLLRDYVEWRRRYQYWRTDVTVSLRTRQLRRLQRWLEAHGLTFVTASYFDLLDFLAQLDGGPESLSGMTSAVKGLYEYMVEVLELREDDPARKLRRPRVPRRSEDERERRAMPIEYVERALTYASAEPEIFAQLTLVFCLGLRCCEVARLDRSDVERLPDGTGRMFVHGKGLKGRTLPVPESVMSVLAPFLRGPGPVFPRPSDGRRHTANMVSWRLNRYLHQVCDIEHTAHTGRGVFATTYYQLDPNAYRLARLMGHASIETTALYTRTRPAESLPPLTQLAEARLARAPKPRRRSAGQPREATS